MKLGTIEIVDEDHGQICREFRVAELAVFGSALREDFTEDSDIDLLVSFEPGVRIGFLKLARLQGRFEGLLGRSIDLIPKGGLKPAIREAVLSSSRVIYHAA